MTRRTILAILAAWLTTTPSGLHASDPTILLDSFEDDTAGAPPGAPETGTVFYTAGGSYLVQSAAGGQVLRATVTAPESLYANWSTSDSTNQSARLTYRARLESGTALHSSTALLHGLSWKVTDSTYASIDWDWGDDLVWRLNGNNAKGSFSLDTTYDFVWHFDFGADTYDLTVSGVPLVQAVGIGTAIGFDSFSQTSSGTSDLAAQLDELRATQDLIFASGFDTRSPAEWSAYSPSQLPGNECPLPGLLGQGIDTPGTLDAHTGASGDDSAACGTSDTVDRWLLYQAQCTGTVTVTTCLPATEFDTVVAVFDGCGGTQLACNDDAVGSPIECDLSGSNRKSEVSFAATAGVTYPIRVAVYNDTFPASDAKDFAVRAECAPTP